MSNLLPSPESEECRSLPGERATLEALPARSVHLGSLEVHRLLPVRSRRLIGPWCFFDRFGPLTFAESKPMDVAPHPHIGLQTLSWLFSGEVVHHDSLDNECLVRPGHLSLMTAGRGIAHTEETPSAHTGLLDGVQFWVALPDAHRHQAPHYQCVPDLTRLEPPGGLITPFLGALSGAESPGLAFSPAIGVDLTVHPGARLSMPLRADFEYGLFLAHGDASVFGQPLAVNCLYYLGTHRGELEVGSASGCRLLLLGGEPFPEKILMWWNFVARSAVEIASARDAWQAQQGFGHVRAYRGPRLEAPIWAGISPRQD